MKYLVRTSVEYSIVLEAESEEAALAAAALIPCNDWDSAWAPTEAEESA